MTNETAPTPIGRPELALYHPNAKNSGSAVRFAVIPATYDHDGSLRLVIAKQQSVAGPTGGWAAFDWANAATVKLAFVEVAEFLAVLGGQASVLAHAGKEGLYHNTPATTTSISFKRSEDPCRPGFLLGVGHTPKADPNARQYHTFAFTPAEALGLRLALTAKMGELAFGKEA